MAVPLPSLAPTIQLDWRRGSGELESALLGLGLPIQKCELPFADLAWLGRGPGECPVPVGIERKSLSDFINSAVSGRLLGQAIGMAKCYQEVWTIVEGIRRLSGIACRIFS